MRISYCGVVLVGLLLLCSAAAATEINLNTSSPWLVAGSGETSTITVTVTNETGAMANVPVDLSLSYDGADDSTLTPLQRTTDGNGNATATFQVGTKSGDVTITATTPDGATGEQVQRVDHAAPYRLALKDYTSEAMVGSEMPIVLAMEDRYGNRIDNRWETVTGRDPETVTFSVGSPEDSAVFVDSGTDTAVCPVDENGNVTVTLRMSRKAGENIVFVDLPDPIADEYFTFYGLSTAPPASITCTISAQGDDPLPWVPADGKSTFNFTCTLKDADGNPSVNQSLNIATSLSGEEAVTLRSNAEGQVLFTYGPKDTTGKVTITMTAAVNSSVTCSRTVEFTSTAPVDMLLTASPQTMPSSDVNPDQTAEIRAKVVDIKGNPVAGENVTFSISDVDTTGYNVTAPPELIESSAITNEYGFAIVPFKPGAFVQDGKSEATGTCNVTAVWHSVGPVRKNVSSLSLTWKNYPYLSVSTSVDKEKVNLTKDDLTGQEFGLVNVTITFKGDGYALRPDPIDVVLVIDRSGSMKSQDSSGNVRITSAKTAASTFIDQMDAERDRVGLVSFSSTTRQDSDLTDDFSSVKSKIQSLRADGATQLRRAIYEAVKMQQEQGRPEAVKAVIVMTDGDWNYDGSPLGHGIGLPDGVGEWSGNAILYDYYEYYNGLGGTLDPGGVSVPYASYYSPSGYKYNWEYKQHCHDGESTNQNMSRFALSNDAKLYAITFAYNPSSTVTDTMTTMSTSTGGFYEHAPSGDKLTEIYKRIAGELKTEAGVNTTMDVSFKNVEVNGVSVPGDDVFAYQHNSNSTYIKSWIDNQTPPYVPPHDPSYPYIEDQTHDWDQNKTLSFDDIGTIHLSQTWTTTYTLQVLKDGNINIFGNDSVISFDNGNETLDLPKTYITATHLNNSGINTSSALSVRGLGPVGEVTDQLRLNWKLNYTGNYTAAQALFYSPDDRKTWVPFQTSIAPEGRTSGEIDESAVVDVSDFQPGDYWIRVSATAPDAPPAQAETSKSITIGDPTKPKIKLQ